MYCVFLGKAVQTVNPPNGSVGLSQLSATGTKDATTFLRGDNTFASAGGDNTPAFFAQLSADQSITNNTFAKANINSELFDTDNCYDNSTNYRFTPTTAGKYALQAGVLFESVTDGTQGRLYIRKNGSELILTRHHSAETGSFFNLNCSIIADANGTSDYFEVFVYHDEGSNLNISGGTIRTYFGGFKLIGV
jgi:hypothetical protein